MKLISLKYKAVRSYLIKENVEAFVILFRGSHFLARAIQFFDDSYYNHVGVGFLMNCEDGDGLKTRVMVIDSNGDGVQPRFLSERITGYSDFCVIRYLKHPKELERALDIAFDRGEVGTRYDFLLLPKIAAYKIADKFRKLIGIKPKNRVIDADKKRDICSEFAKLFVSELGQDVSQILTPQDFERYRDKYRSVLIEAFPQKIWTDGTITFMINEDKETTAYRTVHEKRRLP